jgi:multiple sugar transport system permease protein
VSTQTTASPRVATLGAREGSRVRFSDNKPAWLFLAPFAIFFALFLVVPTIYMVISSFFNTSIAKSGLGSFAGFANYQEMLSKREFWDAMWHTLQFTLYTVPPLVVLAFVFAVLANRVRRGQWFFRLAFFVPFILPSATISLIWVFIFAPGNGLFAQIQTWLGNAVPAPVLAGVAIATLWWTIGFNFILYLAGLQDIPRELYEAAAIDGTTPWQQIRYITIPLLSRTTSLIIVLQIIASLKIFDQVYLMTSGGPGTSTQTAIGLITNTAFTDFRSGAASAAAVLLFIVILAIAAIRQLIERNQERTA